MATVQRASGLPLSASDTGALTGAKAIIAARIVILMAMALAVTIAKESGAVLAEKERGPFTGAKA